MFIEKIVKITFLLFVILPSLSFSSIDRDWVRKVESSSYDIPDNWLKEAIQPLENIDEELRETVLSSLNNDNLIETFRENFPEQSQHIKDSWSENSDSNPNFYVAISFSIPDEYWKEISGELAKLGGVFVVRGFPKDSMEGFLEQFLKKNNFGDDFYLHVNPLVFRKYQVKNAPTIIVPDGSKYDKIEGMISIRAALEKMAMSGDTVKAKALWKKLKS